LSILVSKEDALSGVAPKHHVINGTFKQDAQLSGHAGIESELQLNVNARSLLFKG